MRLLLKISDMLVFKDLLRKLTEAVEYLFIVNQIPKSVIGFLFL